jgi:molybdate transport system ATP-binding protein
MLEWKDCTFKISDNLNLNLKNFSIYNDSFVTIVGTNGSGKTSFARALANELKLIQGTTPTNLKVATISFEKQIELIEQDFKLRNTDIESELVGLTPFIMFKKVTNDLNYVYHLCNLLNFTHVLNKSYHLLSSGEGRKALIIEALLKRPELLVLDAPFDGLDIQAREDLKALLKTIYNSGTPIIVIVNRFDEIHESSNYLGIIMSLELSKFGLKEEILNDKIVHQLSHYEHLPKIYTLPQAPTDCTDLTNRDEPMVIMQDVTVKYGNHIVLNKLNLTIQPYTHWQFSGPNGCGKSTILSLITGDNPQSYGNDITLFGIKRGSGESIWDIKKHIGYVSPALHLEYRVNTSVLNVVLSGYFDSIGLYEQPGDEKISLALAWLKLLGLKHEANSSFKSLSFGQQRLILIIRALVKHPPLLILDEPLQGLDSISRELVRRFIEFFIKNGKTQVLFVSHHSEDAPKGITDSLEFIKNEDTTYNVVIKKH